MIFVQLVTYNKYWLSTEQRVHLLYISVFRRRVHTEPFPVGLFGEKYCFHGSGRLCLLYSQSSHPIPVLLGPLVSYCLTTDRTSLHTQRFNHYTNIFHRGSKHIPTYEHIICFSIDDFLAPFRLSDYKQTSTQDEDGDVAAERQRIYNGGSKTDVLQIRDLSKVKITGSPMFVISSW